MGFRDRIAQYNAQRETKVNPPEAAKVLETQSEPEVEYKSKEERQAPAISETPGLFGDAPAAAVESSATASAEAPKARGRGRPAGSKNSPKQPTDDTASEGTSAPVPSVTVAGKVCTDVNELVSALNAYGYTVTLTR